MCVCFLCRVIYDCLLLFLFYYFFFVGLYYLYTRSRFHLLESPSFPYIALEILNLF